MGRRAHAAPLAYGEGILVCPTNAGAVFGVDFLTHRLLWAYAYRDRAAVKDLNEMMQQGMMTGRGGRVWMANGMAMGSNGRVTFTPAQISAAAKGTVYVKLGEFWVMPTVSSVRAGKVTFIAQNAGMAVHELMIERAPIKLSAPGQPVEAAAMGMIDDMKTGQSGRMTVHLTPGKYVLFCNVPGHYSSGQHITFTVTK